MHAEDPANEGAAYAQHHAETWAWHTTHLAQFQQPCTEATVMPTAQPLVSMKVAQVGLCKGKRCLGPVGGIDEAAHKPLQGHAAMDAKFH